MNDRRPTAEEWAEKGLCRVEMFKDRVCGYRGPEGWCDHTRARCRALGNEDRFDCAKPPIVELRTPWWEIGCGLGMITTYRCEVNATLAMLLYTLFSILLVPTTRQLVFFKAQRLRAMLDHWRTLQQTKDKDKDK